MKRIGFPAVLTALALSGAGCLVLEPDVKKFEDVAAEIGREAARSDLPSLAVCVVRGDSITWEGYYGYADKGSRKEADSSTVYTIASVSKLIAVTAFMQLWEQGLIDIEGDAGEYLPFPLRNPHFPDRKITPLHLLTHTSGLAWPETDEEVPGFYERFPLDGAPLLRDWIPEFLLPGGSRHVPAVWKPTAPGERELYSNIGIAVLAYIVENVSGSDYTAYCREHIFAPLHMESTSFAYADLDPENLATPYETPTEQIPPYRYLAYPSGDLKTTARDFSRFLICYMNEGRYRESTILRPTTVDQILRIRNPASGRALVWSCTLGDWYAHAGGRPGAAAYTEFRSDTGAGLVIFSNYNNSTVYPGNKIHALVRRIAEDRD